MWQREAKLRYEREFKAEMDKLDSDGRVLLSFSISSSFFFSL